MNSYQSNKLEILNISKAFDSTKVLKDISIHVKKGELVSIVGQSGCGKTTLFNIIAGLQKPDDGKILIDAEDFTNITGRVSYMQQKDLLLPWKTVVDNVAIPLYLKGTEKKEARKIALEYFELFGLKGYENVFPNKLSGGMKQRAALLRTYLFSKDIMLLDEPFGALDAINREKLQKWIKNILKQLGAAVLLITHEIDEAAFLSDRLYVMSEKPSVIKAEYKCSEFGPYELKAKVIDVLGKV
jgi:ABC-type nitrate/sulfonate/bicarbonate transport system ATPase subunit